MLIVAVVLLIINSVAISRDYQDSWILEGLEIPFVFFVITYVAAFFSERRLSRMVLLAIVGRTVFLLIPNLKYVWFQGPYYDQHMQYALANHVYNEGHVTSQLTFSPVYTTTPLEHLFFSIFSIVMNVRVVDSMKYLPVLWSLAYPLLVYVIAKNMNFSRKTTILRYALFVSSIPFAIEQYIVTGSHFGILLAFFILSCLFSILQKNDRRYWLVCTIFALTLALAHSVTLIILAASLFLIMAIQRTLSSRPKSYLRASAILTVVSITAASIMFQATPILEAISYQLFSAVPSGLTPQSEYISYSFFEHARTNIISAAKSFTVYYGADAFFLLLTIAGLIVLLKMRRKLNSATTFLSIFGWSILIFMLTGYIFKIGAPRSMHFIRLLFPFLSSVFVTYAAKNTRVRTLVLPITFLLIILLGTIELYGCQPLVPPANVLYKDLPPDVPMSYVNLVNSIYQRKMIYFAEDYVDGKIAAASPTSNQILGLTQINFSMENLVRYYPLEKSSPEREYDYFLIHLPRKSGPPYVGPRLRTENLIVEAVLNSSVVYTNCEAYIIIYNYTNVVNR
jgi:hypothetical protein